MVTTIDITPRLYSDSIELMDLYIQRMRWDEDYKTIPHMLNRFNDKTFESKRISKDQLRQLAVYATDKIYKFATELEVRDAYTVVYFKEVVARLMKSLQKSGVSIFFILDNELRQDRFELLCMLFELSGAAAVAPYSGNTILSFKEVEEKLKSHMAQDRNIIYVEKDASVNYMENVMRLEDTNSKYIWIFRNQAPSTNYFKVL